MATMADTIFPDSHVGFDSITSQIERKLLKRGFQFNIICVGTSRPPAHYNPPPRPHASSVATPASLGHNRGANPIVL